MNTSRLLYLRSTLLWHSFRSDRFERVQMPAAEVLLTSDRSAQLIRTPECFTLLSSDSTAVSRHWLDLILYEWIKSHLQSCWKLYCREMGFTTHLRECSSDGRSWRGCQLIANFKVHKIQLHRLRVQPVRVQSGWMQVYRLPVGLIQSIPLWCILRKYNYWTFVWRTLSDFLSFVTGILGFDPCVQCSTSNFFSPFLYKVFYDVDQDQYTSVQR